MAKKNLHLTEKIYTVCDHCGKEFVQEFQGFYLCEECAKKEFYTIEYFHAYLDTFFLSAMYRKEYSNDIYDIDALTEFVNEDKDHFIEFCIDCYNS